MPVPQKSSAPLSATDPVVREGLFTIDVVVSDATGKPVSDLTPLDFTLLDNGRPAEIRTFHGSLAVIEPAPEVIFVLDVINLSSQQLTQTESAIAHFLRRNNGRLDSPCFLYRLTRDGLFSSLKPTRDGNLLAKEVEQHKSPRTVWRLNPTINSGQLAHGRAGQSPTSSLCAPWARLPSIRGIFAGEKSWCGSVRDGP
jgi:hypothetical protein